MIRNIRLIGERRGYDAATEANEDVLPEQFCDEEAFLDCFYDAALEYEEGTRELEGFSLVEEDMDEDTESEIWESYSIGVRLGIKRRWQEVMGMFRERG